MENPAVLIQGFTNHMHASLESSSAQFLIGQTPIQSTDTPISVIFQTPLQQQKTSWVRFATPKACQPLDPHPLVDVRVYQRPRAYDVQVLMELQEIYWKGTQGDGVGRKMICYVACL